MPQDRRPRPKVRPRVLDSTLDDADTNRLTTSIVEQQERLAIVERRSFVLDLVVGTNRFNHGLGARALGVTVAPTVADATFGWAFAIPNDRQVTITVVGVAQPKAVIEVFR